MELERAFLPSRIDVEVWLVSRVSRTAVQVRTVGALRARRGLDQGDGQRHRRGVQVGICHGSPAFFDNWSLRDRSVTGIAIVNDPKLRAPTKRVVRTDRIGLLRAFRGSSEVASGRHPAAAEAFERSSTAS